MSEIIKNRSEIVFIYDIKDANPNGDPLDENRPRIDEETETNIVTDVRLKRTIRDYLYNFGGYNDEMNRDIFVREIEYEPGKIQDAKRRAEDFLTDEKGGKLNKSQIDLNEMKERIYTNVVSRCIDVRLFGATIPLEKSTKEKSSITLIGPVQFRFGRSLHRVDVKHIKGTGAFASGEGKEKKTFREEYILPYSLIAFYGVINENAARSTKLTEDDVDKLMEAMWNGTKNLVTRTKVGQVPRLLLRVIYKEENYHIGDLDKKIGLVKSIDDKEIRNITDVKIDISNLIDSLKSAKGKISMIEFEVNEDVIFTTSSGEFRGSEIEKAFASEELAVVHKPIDL